MESELWATMYPEQVDAEEVHEGGNWWDKMKEIARGTPHKDRDLGEELSKYFETVSGLM